MFATAQFCCDVILVLRCFIISNFSFNLKKCIFTTSDVDRNSNSDGSLYLFLSFSWNVDFQMLQHFHILFSNVYFKFPSLSSAIKRFNFRNQVNAINVKLFYVAIDHNVIAGQRRFEYLLFHKFVNSMLECNRWLELRNRVTTKSLSCTVIHS